jgi:hypothetical protein
VGPKSTHPIYPAASSSKMKMKPMYFRLFFIGCVPAKIMQQLILIK